jgi:hypothetical protein
MQPLIGRYCHGIVPLNTDIKGNEARAVPRITKSF